MGARPVSVPTSLHVCLINLDRSPERLAEFRKINAHLSEDFTRLSAVDGKTLDLGVLQSAGLITSDILTTYSTNELACAMSHIALWKRGLASGEIITIAEDDAIFHQEFQRHATEAIARLSANASICSATASGNSSCTASLPAGTSTSLTCANRARPCISVFERGGVCAP